MPKSVSWSKLAGETDPEKKRKIIGNLFVDIFEEESKRLANAKWLAQGTIYPDVIESAGAKTGKAHNIKSHHNVGGLPDYMTLQLLEPLRELFKDEVRAIGEELGLPHRMVWRHPFPGPGLGVRILGEIKKEYCDILRQADAIYIDELYQSGHYDKISQAFAVFLPVKSVGVMGDGRTYEYVIALRAVETKDFMTAGWYPMPYADLARISNRIINEVRGVNRVTYDISSKHTMRESESRNNKNITYTKFQLLNVAVIYWERLPGIQYTHFITQLSTWTTYVSSEQSCKARQKISTKPSKNVVTLQDMSKWSQTIYNIIKHFH